MYRLGNSLFRHVEETNNSAISRVPWSFHLRNKNLVTPTFDVELMSIFQLESQLSTTHRDGFNFGNTNFIPNCFQGVNKYWFILCSKNADKMNEIIHAMNDHPDSGPKTFANDGNMRNTTLFCTESNVKKLLYYVKCGEMKVIRQTPGQVLVLEPGVIHTVLTVFDTAQNHNHFSLLIAVAKINCMKETLSVSNLTLKDLEEKKLELTRYHFYKKNNFQNYNIFQEKLDNKINAINKMITTKDNKRCGINSDGLSNAAYNTKRKTSGRFSKGGRNKYAKVDASTQVNFDEESSQDNEEDEDEVEEDEDGDVASSYGVDSVYGGESEKEDNEDSDYCEDEDEGSI
jgi:hypothetical protein